MSRGGEVGPILWGDDEYTLRLGIGEQRKVQERCDAGLVEIGRRLATLAVQLTSNETASMRTLIGMGFGGEWRVDDVREVILRGLVGGGMTEREAAEIVRERLDEQLDFRSAVPIAYATCMAAICGPEDEPLGESKGAAAAPTPSPEESSASPKSTARGKRSA